MAVSRVEDIVKGGTDSTGLEILAVYAKVTGRYAVYRTNEQVMIQFADDDSEGVNQRAALAPLASLRSEVNGMINALRCAGSAYQLTKAEGFDRRLGHALATALQGDIQAAQAELLSIRTEMDEDRASDIRTRHLVFAAGATAGMVLIAAFLSSDWFDTAFARDVSPLYWNAAGVGAIGALFSISLQIRSRQVPIDLQPWDNFTDAVLRVFVGAVSAILLVALLSGELVKLSIGGDTILDDTHGKIVVAFVAGFTERLVSNFLSGLSLTGRTAPPVGGTAGAPRGGANETTVTGGAAINSGTGQRPPGAARQPAAEVPVQPVNEDSELLDEPDEEEIEASGGDDETPQGTPSSNAAEPVG